VTRLNYFLLDISFHSSLRFLLLSYSSYLLNLIGKNFTHKLIRCAKNYLCNWELKNYDSCKNCKTKLECFSCQMFALIWCKTLF
jgi:hypothetical protein